MAGTSARTGFYRAQSVSPEELAPLALQSAQHHPIALVFGREDKGLFNEEIALCTHLIHIPSSEIYTSINLSHAVMICTYELFKQADLFIPTEEKAEEASTALRERMFALWREMMIKTEFTQVQKLDHMMMGIRRIFLRGKLTIPDTKILMGLAKQSVYVADQLKKPRKIRWVSNGTLSEITSITKAEIAQLPLQAYQGAIQCIHTAAEAEQAATRLLQQDVLGFDTETRPSFRKGEVYPPALLQLASEHEIVLFQIQQCGLTPSLIKLLSAPEIIKAGVAVKRDIDELREMQPFEPAGFIDLAEIAKAHRLQP